MLADVISCEIPVCGGTQASLSVRTRENVVAVLPEHHGEIRAVMEIPRFLYAGVAEGDAVGKVIFYADGEKVGEAILYAEIAVPIARKEKNFWKIIFSFLYGRKRES